MGREHEALNTEREIRQGDQGRPESHKERSKWEDNERFPGLIINTGKITWKYNQQSRIQYITGGGGTATDQGNVDRLITTGDIFKIKPLKHNVKGRNEVSQTSGSRRHLRRLMNQTRYC